MQKKSDGQFYAPEGSIKPVCGKNEFPIGVIGLDHGHIFGMCNGLKEAGADIVMVWDQDPARVANFKEKFPEAAAARCEKEVLESEKIKLIASAAIPDCRGHLGLKAMEHGKDYFSDKPPLVSLEQLTEVRKCCRETGQKFAVYYSERLHVEAAVYAGKLIKEGAIGKVVHVTGCGPHRASLSKRPEWFFDKKRYGGILVDLGCHQIEQILYFTGSENGSIASSRTANYYHQDWPDFEDYGDATINCDNGSAGYFRVDWFTPNGLGAWGDGRTFVIGTDGYIELRKYLDVASDPEGDHLYLVNHEGEYHFNTAGTCGFPYFGRFIRDCLDRTEKAMTQEHVFRAIELALIAQEKAVCLN